MKIQQFISERTREAGSSGVVIGVSGGIDSSVVLTLAAKALTPHRVLGLLMPRKNITPAQDIKDAELLAMDLGVFDILSRRNIFSRQELSSGFAEE